MRCSRAARRALAGTSQPASLDQDVGNLGRDHTAPRGDVGPVVTQSFYPQAGQRVVPVDVAPAFSYRVRGGPIQFHTEEVVVVKVVQVAALPAERHWHLPPSGRQAVGSLYPMHVAVLQQG